MSLIRARIQLTRAVLHIFKPHLRLMNPCSKTKLQKLVIMVAPFWKLHPFPKCCVFLYLEFQTMDKVQKPSNSDKLVMTKLNLIEIYYCFKKHDASIIKVGQ
jgi:hypothetical protein